MPLHDWTRVDAGIYHHFHHEWISEIHRALLPSLPPEYYCLAEQYAGGFGPDVLALAAPEYDDRRADDEGAVALAKVKTRIVQESPDDDFFLLKKKVVVVRHASGDRVVAVIELISPANNRSRLAAADFVEKAQTLLARRVHMLIVDPFPATRQASSRTAFTPRSRPTGSTSRFD